MRALPIICALTVALTGCTIPVATTGQAATEERKVGGNAGAGGSLVGKPGLAGGNLVAAGAGNLVAAGAGNLVAAGAGNLTSKQGAAGLVAAGAGNAMDGLASADNGGGLISNEASRTSAGPPAAAPAPGPAASTAPSPLPSVSPSSLIGVDGASLVGMDAGSLVSPAGGALAAISTDNAPGGLLEEEIGPEEPGTAPATVDVHGVVRGPAALAGRTGTLPVGGARVGLFTLAGTRVAEATTAANGTFTLAGSVPPGLVVLRAAFKAGERTVYLAAVADTADTANALDLDPISTLFEARFFVGLAGETVAEAHAEGAAFPAWHASGAAIVDEVTLDQLAATATLAQRAAAFDALAAKHPGAGGFSGLLAYLGVI